MLLVSKALDDAAYSWGPVEVIAMRDPSVEGLVTFGEVLDIGGKPRVAYPRTSVDSLFVTDLYLASPAD